MDFIPTIMMIKYMGFTNYRLYDVEKLTVEKRPVNKLKDRPVYQVGNLYYKIFENSEIVQKILDKTITGFYNESSPHFSGFIFDGETPRGYVTRKCDTLHTNPEDIVSMRNLLVDLFRKHKLFLKDFHEENFGKWRGRTVLLDLDDIVPYEYGLNSKDPKYNKRCEQIVDDPEFIAL